MIGTSAAGLINSGYVSSGTRLGTTSLATAIATTCFGTNANTAVDATSGVFILVPTGNANEWVCTHSLADEITSTTYTGAGKKTLSTALDRVVVTSASTTDTLDAGSVQILYE